MANGRDNDYRGRSDYERGRGQQGGYYGGERWRQDQGDDHRPHGGYRQQYGERFGEDFNPSRQGRGWDDEYESGRGGTFGMGTERSGPYGGSMAGGHGGLMGGYEEPDYGSRYGEMGRRYGYGSRDEGSSSRRYAGSEWGYRGQEGPGRRSSGRHYGGGERGYSEGGRDFWDKASDEVSSWFGDEEAERRRRMDQHRGRGPKNYMRSDERIKEDVNDRLTDDGWIDASNIEVEVSNREVTLSGFVDNRHAKRRAEDIVEDISGVTNVQNNLRVRNETQSLSDTQGSTASGLSTSSSKRTRAS